MAKEQEVETTSPQAQDPAAFLGESLKQLIARPEGLEIKVGDQTVTLRGDVTEIKVGSAWIMFACMDCVFRTDSIADRNSFWSWVVDGGAQMPNMRFMKVRGTLPSRPVPEEEPQRNHGFIPRARRHYGRAVA